MSLKKFSKGEALRFGWRTMKSNLGFFIVLLIIAWVSDMIPSFIADKIKEENTFLGIIFNLISLVISIVISIGLTKISLKFCDNEKARFADLFSYYRLFFKFLFGYFLYGLIILGGTILLIIPGIIWGIKFWFFPYLIIDEGLGPIEALKRSSAITKGTKWNLFIFGLLLIGINLLGFLCLGIGLFATFPTTMVAVAYVYRSLLKQTEITSVPQTSL